MSSTFHGIVSLGLTIAAILIATGAASQTWRVLGVLYLVTCAASLAAILWALCAKCPCRPHCAHVVPGSLAVLVGREPGPYSRPELAATVVVALLLLLGLPQLWLWRYLVLAAGLWVCVAVALVEVRGFVCRSCDNVICPAIPGG